MDDLYAWSCLVNHCLLSFFHDIVDEGPRGQVTSVGDLFCRRQSYNFYPRLSPESKNLFDYAQICRGIYAHAKRACYNGRDLLYACPCVFWGPLDVGVWVVGTCIIQHVRTKTNGGAHIIVSVVQTGQNANSFSIVFFNSPHLNVAKKT